MLIHFGGAQKEEGGGWPLGAQGGRREASVVWDKDEDLTKWKDGVIREDPEWMKEHLRQM